MKAILGGGISGLSAAHYLLSKFPESHITIYEASSRTGGWIKSNKLPNGVVFEQGPRTIRPRGESGYNTLQLLDELDLTEKIIPISTSHPAAKNRMVYAKGKLCTLPSSFQDTLKISAPFSKPLFLYLMNDLVTRSKKADFNDESIYNFVERRFGKDIAEYAISPLICGICAGNSKDISVKFLMKSIFDKEQKYGSISLGFLMELWKNRNKKLEVDTEVKSDMEKYKSWSVYSLQDGLETLPKTLEKTITMNGGDILLNKNCKEIHFLKEGATLTLEGSSEAKVVKHIISSIPAQNLARLVKTQHPRLAENLEAIPNVTVAVVNLHYSKKLGIQDAFGFLVPPSENIPILGVIFDTCCFPNSDNTVLTVMMGGHWFDKLFGTTPTETFLLSTAVEQIKNILNIHTKPDNFKVNILRDCIPQYVIGHSDRVEEIETYISKNNLALSICGSSYHGVGVNDVILSAKNAVDRLDL